MKLNSTGKLKMDPTITNESNYITGEQYFSYTKGSKKIKLIYVTFRNSILSGHC